MADTCPHCGEMETFTTGYYVVWKCQSNNEGRQGTRCRIRCLEREVERLKSALLKYGVHGFDCWVRQVGVNESGVSCNCGWEELLDDLEGRNG